jgi:hypothetical protein
MRLASAAGKVLEGVAPPMQIVCELVERIPADDKHVAGSLTL